MQIGHPSQSPNFYDEAGDYRTPGNQVSLTLLTGQEGAPDNYRLGYGRGGSGGGDWTAPRHRHTFEQIRYPLNDDLIIGHRRIVPKGWVAYFPESVYYGPQVRKPGLHMLVLQFGGPSGDGYDSGRQIGEGRAGLLAATGGRFENGIFRWVDADGKHRSKDAAEAVYEFIRGRPTVYPPARYSDIVLMNPAAFEYRRNADGVACKWLGTFTERQVRVGFVRLEPGQQFLLGTADSVEVAVVTSGAVTYHGQHHDRLTAFGTEATEGAQPLAADGPAELFYVKLPTFSEAERSGGVTRDGRDPG